MVVNCRKQAAFRLFVDTALKTVACIGGGTRSQDLVAKKSVQAPHRLDLESASARRKIRFIAIKEAIEFDGKQDLRTKVMIALFGLFAEVERDLISERTKEGLAAAKAKGQLLGRPKGALGTSACLRPDSWK